MNDLTGKIRSLDDLSDVQADSVAREVVAFAAGMMRVVQVRKAGEAAA
mgnify:CR=1 FL=1